MGSLYVPAAEMLQIWLKQLDANGGDLTMRLIFHDWITENWQSLGPIGERYLAWSEEFISTLPPNYRDLDTPRSENTECDIGGFTFGVYPTHAMSEWETIIDVVPESAAAPPSPHDPAAPEPTAVEPE